MEFGIWNLFISSELSQLARFDIVFNWIKVKANTFPWRSKPKISSYAVKFAFCFFFIKMIT